MRLVQLIVVTAGLAPAGSAAPVSFENEVRPLLQARCGSCHDAIRRKGALDLTSRAGIGAGGESGPVVVPGEPERSPLVRVVSGDVPEMPPSGEWLSAAEVALLRRWIAEGARAGGVADGERSAGLARVMIRRLSRPEYDNTVRDLLGSGLRPSRSFPEDGVSHGFDRIADALSLSPAHIEEYERAAESLTDELFGRPADDPVRRRILFCSPEGRSALGCAERILRGLAARAWRRPVRDEELAPFLALVRPRRHGGIVRPSEGLRLAIQALLLSPSFLFRIERPPLHAYDVASRLGYFLWSSMPDDELQAAAADGSLRDPEEIERQVRRMLADPRARSLAADFGGQWLGLRRLENHSVSRRVFRGWNVDLRRSMVAETVRFLEEFVTSPRPVREMLTARFTFVDGRLAPLYGLPPTAAGDELVRVDLGALPRRGLLTQPAILTLTSHPDRTSPTARGQFVLDRLLCQPPPPAPPGVPDLEESRPKPNETLREVLERHRTAPNCRVCHEEMDGLGLGLEPFDLVGRFREDGNDTFSGPDGPLAALLARGEQFERCLTKQLLAYALGRGFDGPEDLDVAAQIARRAAERGGSLRDVVVAIATSPPFSSDEGPSRP